MFLEFVSPFNDGLSSLTFDHRYPLKRPPQVNAPWFINRDLIPWKGIYKTLIILNVSAQNSKEWTVK